MLLTCCTVHFVEILKLSRCGNKTKKQWYGKECFHMTSRRPYWCFKQWKGGMLVLQTNPVGVKLFYNVNAGHRCWPREWKRPISLRTLPIFPDANDSIPAKWRLRNERRNSILMTRHYPDLGMFQISRVARKICFNQSGALPRSG